MPTFPRAEKPATWLLLSVWPSHGVLMFVPPAVIFITSLVIRRGCSMAPTVMTFLAVDGDTTLSGLPFNPSSSPPPVLPAENTNRTGCEPVRSGSASRTAAS